MLELLSGAGAPVPSPIARSEDAILMTYVGDEDDAAPQLRSIRPSPAEAQDMLDQIVRAVTSMLYRNVVHGDLSAYNVLVWDELVTIIDLPQAVDIRTNRHARGLLERDIARIVDHLKRFGARGSASAITHDLYVQWQYADLIPEELRVELEI